MFGFDSFGETGSSSPSAASEVSFTTGWCFPTSTFSGGGWGSKTNFYTINGLNATYLTLDDTPTDFIYIRTFDGLQAPTGATIAGVEVLFKGGISSGIVHPTVNSQVYLTIGTGFTTRAVQVKQIPGWAGEPNNLHYCGGLSDLWGEVDTNNNSVKDRDWTAADIASINVAFDLRGRFDTGINAFMDTVAIRVAYSLPTTGSIAVTQADDTGSISASVLNPVTGTLAATQADDTASITATSIDPVTGSIAATQDANTSSITAALTFSGSIAATQDANTSSITATSIDPVTGSIAATQDANTSSITAALTFSGSIAATQDANTTSIAAALTFSGSIAATQDADTASVSAAVEFPASIAATQADNTASITAELSFSGSIAATQDANTASIAGIVEGDGPGPEPEPPASLHDPIGIGIHPAKKKKLPVVATTATPTVEPIAEEVRQPTIEEMAVFNEALLLNINVDGPNSTDFNELRQLIAQEQARLAEIARIEAQEAEEEIYVLTLLLANRPRRRFFRPIR